MGIGVLIGVKIGVAIGAGVGGMVVLMGVGAKLSRYTFFAIVTQPGQIIIRMKKETMIISLLSIAVSPNSFQSRIRESLLR